MIFLNFENLVSLSKLKLLHIFRSISCVPWILYRLTLRRKGVTPRVQFVVEKNDWAIRTVGKNICRQINSCQSGFCDLSSYPNRLYSPIVHFGSQYMWLAWRHVQHTNTHYESTAHTIHHTPSNQSSHSQPRAGLKAIPTQKHKTQEGGGESLTTSSFRTLNLT